MDVLSIRVIMQQHFHYHSNFRRLKSYCLRAMLPAALFRRCSRHGNFEVKQLGIGFLVPPGYSFGWFTLNTLISALILNLNQGVTHQPYGEPLTIRQARFGDPGALS